MAKTIACAALIQRVNFRACSESSRCCSPYSPCRFPRPAASRQRTPVPRSAGSGSTSRPLRLRFGARNLWRHSLALEPLPFDRSGALGNHCVPDCAARSTTRPRARQPRGRRAPLSVSPRARHVPPRLGHEPLPVRSATAHDSLRRERPRRRARDLRGRRRCVLPEPELPSRLHGWEISALEVRASVG